MNTILIITGAGASHDVADYREINVRPKFQPPLTNNLFTGGAGQTIDSVNEYLIANPIAAQVGKDWKRDDCSLEKYLSDLKNSGSFMLRKRYWAIPIYLHELFLRISDNYINSAYSGIPSNYSSLITAIAKNGTYGQIIWLNLNYDILADYAIKQAAGNALKTFEDYMNLETQDKMIIKYTKPHGSVDWFRRNKASVPWPEIRQGWIPDDFEQNLSSEIYTSDLAHKGNLVDKELRLYPAILAPLGNYDYVYRDHINIIISELEKITSFSLLCIGFSALDQDILGLIKNCAQYIKKIKIVNGNFENGKKAYLNIVKYLCGQVSEPSDDVVFNGGFTTFINKGIDNWL